MIFYYAACQSQRLQVSGHLRDILPGENVLRGLFQRLQEGQQVGVAALGAGGPFAPADQAVGYEIGMKTCPGSCFRVLLGVVAHHETAVR